MRPLFLQLTSNDPTHLGMVSDHRARHMAYCERHGYAYEHDVIDPYTSWARIDYIRRSLLGDWSYIFCMDADIFVADPSHDMCDTLPDWAFYAATIHPYPWRAQKVFHVQCGGFYFKCCETTYYFLDRVLSLQNHFPDDQSAINWLLLESGEGWQKGFNILPARWNQTIQDLSFEESRPIVAAFHGTPNPRTGLVTAEYRRDLMRHLVFPFSETKP